MTERLYYEDAHQRTFTARVASCAPGKHGFDVVLDRTCFYPEGGGQAGDTGLLGGVRVTDTHERDGEVVHYCESPLEIGTEVAGEIDWDARFERMQLHSGEHILSGLVHKHFGYENVELLESLDYPPEAKTQFSSNILTMSHQMRGLVESLLNLARIDQGQKAAAHTPVDLSKLVSDATLPFEALFFEQELTLETDIAPDLTVPGDAAQLRQVVEILLDNAQKYAEAPGTVRVTLARQGHHVRLCVADTGAPLSPEDCKNIFKRFYRLDDARSRDGSFGLGLSIAQSIVDTHHGRIWCESANGLNSFFVELPQ